MVADRGPADRLRSPSCRVSLRSKPKVSPGSLQPTFPRPVSTGMGKPHPLTTHRVVWNVTIDAGFGHEGQFLHFALENAELVVVELFPVLLRLRRRLRRSLGLILGGAVARPEQLLALLVW